MLCRHGESKTPVNAGLFARQTQPETTAVRASSQADSITLAPSTRVQVATDGGHS